MDISNEIAIGDAHISIRGGRHRKGAAHQIEMAAAFPAMGKPKAAEVDAFLARLRGLQTVEADRLFDRLPATPLPDGYRHFRLFDANDGEQWHHSFVYEEGRVLTLHDVLWGALNHPTLELEAWDATEWLPDMIDGVLDLELSFTAVPRTRKPFRLAPSIPFRRVP